MDFKLLTRTANLLVYQCPQCFSEFASSGKALKCPKCRYPESGSDFELQVKRAKSEIRNLIREKGYILSATELQPIIDALLSDFPKVQRADVFGQLELDRDKIRRERYNLDLHQYVEISERKRRAKREERKVVESDRPGKTVGGYNQEPFNDRDFYQ